MVELSKVVKVESSSLHWPRREATGGDDKAVESDESSEVCAL